MRADHRDTLAFSRMNANEHSARLVQWLENHRARLFVFPLVGGLLSFLPLYYLAVAVSGIFSIDPASSLMQQKHGLLFLNLFFVAMVLFVVSGAGLGLAFVARQLASACGCTTGEAWRALLQTAQR